MGIERAVTRWYLQRQTYQNEIASLEAKLAEMPARGQELQAKNEQKSRSNLYIHKAGCVL